MQVSYFKMQGTGNKILVVDRREDDLSPPSSSRLRELGDDETGPGFDQLLWVSRSHDPLHAAAYRVFNADGSEVGQCGNGVRCVAALLAAGPDHPTAFTLESPAGVVSAKVDDHRVSVSMGTPEFEPDRIPFVADARSTRYALEVDADVLDVCAVSMGNPHCVLEVADVGHAPVAELGPKIEHHSRYPERCNVGFMKIVDSANIDLRVYERGVGETLACGTGACAAVVSGQRLERLGERVTVRLPGGEVVVSWRGGTDPVWLTGNAELISKGTMDL